MSEPRKCSPRVVRSEGEAEFLCRSGDDEVDGLRGETFAHTPAFIDGAEELTSGDPGSRGPGIEGGFGPARNRNGADAFSFACEVEDDPAAFPLLNLFRRQCRVVLYEWNGGVLLSVVSSIHVQ
jgi:hypothetical protein